MLFFFFLVGSSCLFSLLPEISFKRGTYSILYMLSLRLLFSRQGAGNSFSNHGLMIVLMTLAKKASTSCLQYILLRGVEVTFSYSASLFFFKVLII